MTKPDGIPAAAWGTSEDLLLAFAVNRHGTHAWDTIASELHKRIPALSLTPQNCRSMYLDLKRRFLGDLPDDGDTKSDALLEELTNLRVAELRREVQRYDINIESLELKMRTMEEERERSLRRKESESDLKQTDVNTDIKPADVGEESEKDQLSVNKSNSTDPETEKLRTGEKKSEPDRAGRDMEENTGAGQTSEEPAGLKREPDQKSTRVDSCNGSSNSIQELDRIAKVEPAGASAGLLVSEAESDGGGGGEEATKENSDVQSSAGRSGEEEGSDSVRRGSTNGDEREHVDQSRAAKELSTESQPLVGFLQGIRAHKSGSVFERRLRSQESSKYQKLILQHIDLETIDSRLKQGWYSGSRCKFFRDLLLLVNNALIFFSKNSKEANAATEIRWLVSKEISQKHTTNSDSSSGKHVLLQSLSMSKKQEPEPEPEPSHTLMLKPLTACRQRSSIATKASATTSIKRKEQTSSPTEEKDTKLQQHATEEAKKRTRDLFSAVSTNTKKNGNNQPNNNNCSSINSVESAMQPGKGGGSTSCSQYGVEAKGKSQLSLDSKKKGAANFLNRMKQGLSSNNNVALMDVLKNTPLITDKNENPKRGEKKVAASKAGSKKKGSPGTRNFGRPPRQAPPPPGKRSREGGESESPASTKQPKKRSRKL